MDGKRPVWTYPSMLKNVPEMCHTLIIFSWMLNDASILPSCENASAVMGHECAGIAYHSGKGY